MNELFAVFTDKGDLLRRVTMGVGVVLFRRVLERVRLICFLVHGEDLIDAS